MRHVSLSALLGCFLLFCGIPALAAPPVPKVKTVPPPKSVLMVGNSFTYFNNGVMSMLVPMLKEVDKEHAAASFFKQMTISGASLSEHRFGYQGVVESRKWDAVVLQGNSTEPITPKNQEEILALQRVQGNSAPKDPMAAPEEFKKYARLYAAIARENGATPVFYMTWAYTGLPGMTAQLAEGYTAIANELDALVVPVGLAFERSLKQRPGLAMLISDDRHPTKAGTYLIACTFLAGMYGKTPVGLQYDAGLSKDDAAFLQKVAQETVQDFYSR